MSIFQKILEPDVKHKIREETSPTKLTKLAQDECFDVRLAVAGNPNTPPEVLAKLAQDKDFDVRMVVANNRNTPPEVLAELAHCKKDRVRFAVAKNPHTPPEVLAELAETLQNHNELRVKADFFEAIVTNPNTPKETLESLAETKDIFGEFIFCVEMVINPDTPSEILTGIMNTYAAKSNDDDTTKGRETNRIRLMLAKHRNATKDMLSKLAVDSHEEVRMAVIENPAASTETLKNIAEYKYECSNVRKAAMTSLKNRAKEKNINEIVTKSSNRLEAVKAAIEPSKQTKNKDR